MKQKMWLYHKNGEAKLCVLTNRELSEKLDEGWAKSPADHGMNASDFSFNSKGIPAGRTKKENDPLVPGQVYNIEGVDCVLIPLPDDEETRIYVGGQKFKIVRESRPNRPIPVKPSPEPEQECESEAKTDPGSEPEPIKEPELEPEPEFEPQKTDSGKKAFLPKGIKKK